MPRITVDLVDQAPQFTNPVRDRELDLRGQLRRSSEPRLLVAFGKFD